MAESSLLDWSQAIHRSRSDLEEITREYKTIINNELKGKFEGETQLAEAATKAVLSGGKRIRPAIALLTCEAICGTCARALPVAMSFELAHAASLIQDDIIDESSLRHNKPTIHSKYGSIRAILVADYLIFSIFGELARYNKIRIGKDRLTGVLLQISNSAKLATKGEFADILLATKGNVEEEEYFDMIGLKTASLFAAPAAAGAIVGGASPRMVDQAYRYGYYLGLSFQIVDDIMDIVGSASDIGKPVFKDLENHSSNIVVIHALSQADQNLKNMIHSMLWKKRYTASDAARIIRIFEDSGALKHAINLASKYSQMSRKEIHRFPFARPKEKLDHIARALVSSLELRSEQIPKRSEDA